MYARQSSRGKMCPLEMILFENIKLKNIKRTRRLGLKLPKKRIWTCISALLHDFDLLVFGLNKKIYLAFILFIL